jgi:chromate reductase, NAD(P)H dehydrogenase (quinone)
MMQILAISGSTRAASTNTALLHALAAAAPAPLRVEVCADLALLPVFSPDAEGPPAPPAVEAFAARIARADALVFATPEYVHALPGGLKNAVDWMVSRPEIIGKPIALLHGSHRGDDALSQLRRVLATVSDGFAPDIFVRFSLISQTPAQILHDLAEPAPRAQLRQFLADLARHAQTAP